MSIKLAKMGLIKVKWSRPLPSEPSSVTVIKDAANRYFLSCVVEVFPEKLPDNGQAIGIDLGMIDFATFNNGEKVKPPLPLKKKIKRLRKLHRHLSRKLKGSKRREIARKKLAILHAKISDTRTDFLHKLSTKVQAKLDARQRLNWGKIMTATIQPTKQRFYTPEEYLSLEEAAEYKSEYHDGAIIPMTGGTTNHNRIALNMSMALRLAFKSQEYDVFISDVRLWIPRIRSYVYPDVMAIAGKPEYYDNRKDTITNPEVIIEVLSKSTRNYDRGDKFSYYRTIPSFQEYILIDQNKIAIEQYSKQSNKRWSFSEYNEEDTNLFFSSLQVEVPLVDIYEKVDFEAEEPEEETEVVEQNEAE
jgi:Uma2 family endonuclease